MTDERRRGSKRRRRRRDGGQSVAQPQGTFPVHFGLSSSAHSATQVLGGKRNKTVTFFVGYRPSLSDPSSFPPYMRLRICHCRMPAIPHTNILHITTTAVVPVLTQVVTCCQTLRKKTRECEGYRMRVCVYVCLRHTLLRSYTAFHTLFRCAT